MQYGKKMFKNLVIPELTIIFTGQLQLDVKLYNFTSDKQDYEACILAYKDGVQIDKLRMANKDKDELTCCLYQDYSMFEILSGTGIQFKLELVYKDTKVLYDL